MSGRSDPPGTAAAHGPAERRTDRFHGHGLFSHPTQGAEVGWRVERMAQEPRDGRGGRAEERLAGVDKDAVRVPWQDQEAAIRGTSVQEIVVARV